MARLEMMAALKTAVDRNEFLLSYQPEIELATGRVVGLEALIRWRRAPGITHLPHLFIPLAEEMGSIVAIGEWVLAEASRRGREWQHGGGEVTPLKMGVNVSVRQLRDPDFADRVERILRERSDRERLGRTRRGGSGADGKLLPASRACNTVCAKARGVEA